MHDVLSVAHWICCFTSNNSGEVQDMIVSVLPGGQGGSRWNQPRKGVALTMRLALFAVEALTAFAVSCPTSNLVLTC